VRFRTVGTFAGRPHPLYCLPVEPMIDRVSPTLRPHRKAIGYMEWRRLLFLHWPVPVAALAPLVPERLSIDLYQGIAYLTVVPFAMQAVRPRGFPSRAGIHLLETNVRTYVHLNGRDPGVYFFSLDASSLLAVAGARILTGLPYFLAGARLRAISNGAVEYDLVRRGRSRPSLSVLYQPAEGLGASAASTLEFFLLERYLLYVRRGRSLWQGRVHHRPYPVHRARVLRLQEELVKAAGLPQPEGRPAQVHYSPGVDVELFRFDRV